MAENNFLSDVKEWLVKIVDKVKDRYNETKDAVEANPIFQVGQAPQDDTASLSPTRIGREWLQTIAKAVHPYTEMARDRAESFADVPLLDDYKSYVEEWWAWKWAIPKFLGRMYADGLQWVFNTPLNLLNVVDALAIDWKPTGPAVVDTVTDVLNAASVFAPFYSEWRVLRMWAADEVAPVVNAISKRGGILWKIDNAVDYVIDPISNVAKKITDNKVVNSIGNAFDKAANTINLIKESWLWTPITIQTLPFTQWRVPDVLDKFQLFDFVDNYQIDQFAWPALNQIWIPENNKPSAVLRWANNIWEVSPAKEQDVERYLTWLWLQVPQDDTKVKFMQEKIDQIKWIANWFGQWYGTKAREYLQSFYGKLGSLNPPMKWSAPIANESIASLDVTPLEVPSDSVVQEPVNVEQWKYVPAKAWMDREWLENLYWNNVAWTGNFVMDKRNILSEELDLLYQQRNFNQQTYLNTIANVLNTDDSFAAKYSWEYESIVNSLNKRFETTQQYAVYRAALYEEWMSDSEIHNKVLQKMYDTQDTKKAKQKFLQDTTIDWQDISIPLGRLKVKADQDIWEPVALAFAWVGWILESAIDSMQRSSRSDLAKAWVSYIINDIDDSPYAKLSRSIAEKAPEWLTLIWAELSMGFLGKLSKFFWRQSWLGKVFRNKAIEWWIQEVTESMALAYMWWEEYTTEENIMDVALWMVMAWVGGAKIDRHINPTGFPPTSEWLERAIFSDPDDPNGWQTLIEFVQNSAIQIASERKNLLEARKNRTAEENLELSELQKRNTPAQIVEYYADDIRESYFFLRNIVSQASEYTNDPTILPDDKRRAIIGDYQSTVAQIKILDRIIGNSSNAEYVAQAQTSKTQLEALANRQAEYIADPKFQNSDPDVLNYDKYLKVIYNAKVQRQPMTQWNKALRTWFRSSKSATNWLRQLQIDLHDNYDNLVGWVYWATKLKSDAYNNAPIQFYDRPVSLSVAEYWYTESSIPKKSIQLWDKVYDVVTYKIWEKFVPVFVDPDTWAHAIMYWFDDAEQTRFKENIEKTIVTTYKSSELSTDKELNREFQSAWGKSSIQWVDTADVQTHHTDTDSGIIYVNDSLTEEQKKIEAKKWMVTQIILALMKKTNLSVKEKQIYKDILNVYTIARTKLSKAPSVVAQMFVTFGHFVQHLFHAWMTKFLKSVKDWWKALRTKVVSIVWNYLTNDDINVIVENAPSIEADESYQVAREVAFYVQYSLSSIKNSLTAAHELFYNSLTDIQKKYKYSHVAAVVDMIPAITDNLFQYMQNTIDWSKGNMQSIMTSLYSVANYFTNKAIDARPDFKRIQWIVTKYSDVANSVGLQLLSIALSDQAFVSNSQINTQEITGIANEELIAMLDETNTTELFDEYAAYITYVLNLDPKYIDVVDRKKIQEVLLMSALNNHQKTLLALPSYNIIWENGRLNKNLLNGYISQFITDLRSLVTDQAITKEVFRENFATLMENVIWENDYIVYNAIKTVNSSQNTQEQIDWFYDFLVDKNTTKLESVENNVIVSLMILNNVTKNYLGNISAYPLTIAKFIWSLLSEASATVYDAEIFRTRNSDNIYAYSSYLNFPEQTIEYIKKDIAKRGDTNARLQEWKDQLIKEYTISRWFGGRNLTINFFQIMQTMDLLEVAPMLDGTSVEKVVAYNLALSFQQYWNTKALGLKASRERQYNPTTVKSWSLVITVGKTWSGKSYRARQFVNKDGYQVFSIHDYVTKKPGEMSSNDRNNAFDEMNDSIRRAMQKNASQVFIIDTSNLQKSRRNQFKSFARLFWLDAYAVPFYTDEAVRIQRAVANGIDQTYAATQWSDDYSQQALEKEWFIVVDETLANSNEGYVIDFINSMNETIGDFVKQSDWAWYSISKNTISINPKKFPIQEAMVNHSDLLFAITKRLDPSTYIEVIWQFYKDNTAEWIQAEILYNQDTESLPLDVLIDDYRSAQMWSTDWKIINRTKTKQIKDLLARIDWFLETNNLPEVNTQLAYAIIDSLRAKWVIPYDASTWWDLMNTYSIDRLYAVNSYNQNYQVYLQHNVVKNLVNRYGLYAYDGDYYNYAQALLDDYINYPETNKTELSLVYRIAHLFWRVDDLNATLPEVYKTELTNDFTVDALNILVKSQRPIDENTVIFLPKYKLLWTTTNINFSIPFREWKIFEYDTSWRDVVFTDMNGKQYKNMSLTADVLENNNIVIVSDTSGNADKAFRKIAKDNAKFSPSEVTPVESNSMDDIVASIKKDKAARKPQLWYSKWEFFYGINIVKQKNWDLWLYASAPKYWAHLAEELNVWYAPSVIKELWKWVQSLENKSLAVPKELVKATSSLLWSVNETKNTVLSNIWYDHKLVKELQQVYNNPDQYYYVFDNLALAIPYYVNNFFAKEQLVDMNAKSIYDLISSKRISESQFIGLFFQRNIIDQVDTLLHLAGESNAKLFDRSNYAKWINKAATMQNFVSFFADKNASMTGKYWAYIQMLYDLVTEPSYRSQWESLITYMDPDGRSESMLDEFLSRSISIDWSTDRLVRVDTVLNQLVNASGIKDSLAVEDFWVRSQDELWELDTNAWDSKFINKTKNSNIQFLAFMSEFVAYNNRPEVLLPFREWWNFVALPLVKALVSNDIEANPTTKDSTVDTMVKFYNREYKYLEQLAKDTGLPLNEQRKKLNLYINRAISKMTGKPYQKVVFGLKASNDIARIRQAMDWVQDIKSNKVFTFSSLINGLNIYTASYADVNALSFVTDITDKQKTLLKKIGVDIDATYSMSLANDWFSLYEEKIYKYISLLWQIQNWAFAMYLPDAWANRKMIAEKLIEDMWYAEVKWQWVVVNNTFSRKKIAEITNKIFNNKLPAWEYQKVLWEFQSLIPWVDLAIDVLNDNQKNFAELMNAMKSVAHQTVKALILERRKLERKWDTISKEIVNAINDVMFSSTDLVQEVQTAVIAWSLQQNKPTELYRRDIDEESLSDLSQLDIAETIDEAGNKWISESYIDQLADEEIQSQVQSIPTQRFVVSLEKFIRTAFSTPAVRTLADLKRVISKYADQIPDVRKVMENNRIFESREQFEKFYETVFNNNPQEWISITTDHVKQIVDYGLNVLDFDVMKKYFQTKNDYKLINMSISDVVWQKKIYDYATDWKNNADTLTTEKMQQIHKFIEQFDQNKILDPDFQSMLQELDVIWREYYAWTQQPVTNINDVVLDALWFDKEAVADRYFNAIEKLIWIANEKQRQWVVFEWEENKLQKEVQTLKWLMDIHYPDDPWVSTLYIENRMRKYFADVLRSSAGTNDKVLKKKEQENRERLENEAAHLNDVLNNCI